MEAIQNASPDTSLLPLLLKHGFVPEQKTLSVRWRPLHPAQEKIKSEMRRFNVASLGRRFGKPLALDTRVPTPEGWTTIGEIRVGDTVFDENGLPTKVRVTSPVYENHDCYKLIFSDGTEIVSDADHLWKTWTHAERKNSRRAGDGTRHSENYFPKIRSAREISETLRVGKRGDTNHSIECCRPLELPFREDLPIPPYTFGAWLGDGHSHAAKLTCVDSEIIENINGEGVGTTFVEAKDRVGYFLLGEQKGRGFTPELTARIVELGVKKNKHIPLSYLRASAPQRLALLQGLMDTDGTCGKNGACEFTSKNRQLAKDILELLGTFGIRATLKTGKATLNGKYISDKYRVFFSTELPVFRLKRKLERLQSARRKYRLDHRFIVGCEQVDSVPVRCIEVENKSHLFLVSGAFIPTHNTFMCVDWCVEPAVNEGLPVAWFAPTAKMWQEVWTDVVALVGKENIARSNFQMGRIELKNGGKIDFWSLEASLTLRGRKYARVVIDEAAHVKDLEPHWTRVIRPTLTDYSGQAFFISTPNGYNYFETLYNFGNDPLKEQWMCWQMPSSVNPYLPEGEIELARGEMDEDSFAQEYLAEFLRGGGAVFRNVDANLVSPENQTPEMHAGHRIVSGVDWAQVQDFTCHAVGCDTCRTELSIARFNQIDWSIQRDRIIADLEKWNVTETNVESNSIGAPNYESLLQTIAERNRTHPEKQIKTRINAVQMTSESKPQLVQSLVLSLQKEQFKFLPDKTAAAELKAYTAKVNSQTGRISYSAPSGGHDDTVVARMMMLKAIHAPGRFRALEIRLR